MPARQCAFANRREIDMRTDHEDIGGSIEEDDGGAHGLAIVHRIAEAHGGFRMALRPGGGLRVEAGFPLAVSAP